METFEIAPDLWRWTGRCVSAGADVASVYYKAEGEILLFDPLLPPEDPSRFWRALDRDVALVGGSVRVLVTSDRHLRSAGDMLERYPGARLRRRGGVEYDRESLPGAVEAIGSGFEDEVVFWLPEQRALIVGDVLAGDGAEGLRVARDGPDPGTIKALLHLDVAVVLPSHGEIPRDSARALRAVVPGP